MKLLTSAAVDRLLHAVDSSLEQYRDAEFQFADGDLLEMQVVCGSRVPALASDDEGSSLTEQEVSNAKAIHEWLPGLTRSGAADARLWTTLCHTTFSSYCARRWALTAGSIRSHWFVQGVGLAGLRRNAIARLWWAAELTTAPPSDHPTLAFLAGRPPDTFLKALFSNQDVYQGLLERSFGSDEGIRYAVLACLSEMQGRGVAMSSRFVTDALKAVNLMCAYQHTGAIDAERFYSTLVDELARRITP